MQTQEPAHTQIEWTIVEHSWSDTGIYAGDVRIAALSISDEATEETQEQLEAEMAANASLIAAAPDLLLACEEAMRLIELLEVLARSDADIYKHELRGDASLFRSRIAPAIDKATGGEK